MNPMVGTPGRGTERTLTPRHVFMVGPDLLAKPVIISGAVSRDPLHTSNIDILRAGLLLGKITASGKYAPSILGVTTAVYNGATSSDATSITVSAATATELVRRIGSSGTFKLTGPPAASGTVATATITFSAVNTTTGVITVTETETDFIAGSFIQPTDGSETILTIIPDVSAQDGLAVYDRRTLANKDVQLPNIPVGGCIDASQIINYPSDSSLKAYVKAALRVNAPGLVFDDDY